MLDLDELKARHPCDVVAGQWVRLRARHGRKSAGPCPFCSRNPQSKSASRFECDALVWYCAVCEDGGDVIRLMARHAGLDPQRDFLRVVDLLGGAASIDPAEKARLDAERERKRLAREVENARYRERERARLYKMWEHAGAWPYTPVDAYLQLRLGRKHLPSGPRLRYLADGCLFADGGERAELVHRGPTMLAAIVGNDGRFCGLHMTFLDLRQPNGKIAIAHAGEQMPAKKVRGSKAGGHIELIRVEAPSRLYLGEGIEKVLAAWLMLALGGYDIRRSAFWTSIDLGNLGGRALESVAHPTLKLANGRAQRVPGPVPDLDAPAIEIPQTVTELVLLGDSTSDPYLTRCALDRAAARYARPGRTVRKVMAPDGIDFDEVMKGAA